MAAFSEKPQKMIDIWRSTLRLYGDGFFKVWYLAAIVGVLSSIVFLFQIIHTQHFALNQKMDIESSLIAIGVGFFLVYFMSVILHRMYFIGRGNGVPLIDSMRLVAKRYLLILVTSVLLFTIIILGLVLFVIPGLIAFIFFVFSEVEILFDNKRVFSAIGASCHLVWGNWWRTFGVILPFLVVMWAVNTGVGMVATKEPILFVVFNIIVMVVLQPLGASVLLAQYSDLLARRRTEDVVITNSAST